MFERAVARTGIDELLEAVLHALEFADALLDFAQPRLGALLHAFHATLAVGGKGQQLADFFQRETEVLGTSDKPQALDYVATVIAVARGAPLRLRQQALTLVIADGIDADAGATGDGADGDVPGGLPVDGHAHAHSVNP